MIDGTPLVEVPAVVVNQLTVAVPSIWFTDNANSCSNCTLVAPLVVWIKAATTNAASSLAVTCRATNGATPSQSGTAAQWKDKPDCIPGMFDNPWTFSIVPDALWALTVSAYHCWLHWADGYARSFCLFCRWSYVDCNCHCERRRHVHLAYDFDCLPLSIEQYVLFWFINY